MQAPFREKGKKTRRPLMRPAAACTVFIVFIVFPAGRLQTLVCDGGRAADRNKAEHREGAADTWQYRRADWPSAGETLTYAARTYRPVVKDPAVWGESKPTGGPPRRRRLAPSAQETNKANRRRIGRRTRPKASGRSGDEHTAVSDQPEAGRCRRCNQGEASHPTSVGALHAPKRFAAVSPQSRGAP